MCGSTCTIEYTVVVATIITQKIQHMGVIENTQWLCFYSSSAHTLSVQLHTKFQDWMKTKDIDYSSSIEQEIAVIVHNTHGTIKEYKAMHATPNHNHSSSNNNKHSIAATSTLCSPATLAESHPATFSPAISQTINKPYSS